jgi:YVTN family beta-propeller protein
LVTKRVLIWGWLALAAPYARLGMAQVTGGTAATFGSVIALTGGTPSDIVLDESRHYLYLVNNNTNAVYVLDYATNQVVNTIGVGSTPLAAAISMDNAWLYVTCSGNSTLNVINLNQMSVTQTVSLASAPQGVEVGNDGRVLISAAGTGVVSGVPQGTLLLYDPSNQSVGSVIVPALPSTPATLPAPTLPTKPQTTFTSKLLRTPAGDYIVGGITPTSSTTYFFVYEVASGAVLRNRTIAGASTVLAMAPDGSKFMAGFTMFDIGTLAILAQQNNANAPFAFTSAVNTLQNVGGSVFSPDGSTLYSVFNTAASTTPTPPASASTLLVNNPSNLAISLGISLPESIVAKMVITAEGSQAWGLSDSGLIHLPLANLYTYPLLMPASTDVFLAMDDCNRGLASGTLQVANAGAGKLTYTVSPPTTAALDYALSSGVAPSKVTFSMDPGRTGLTRYGGTNLWTGTATTYGTQSGTALNVTFTSSDAVNVPNTVRVYMNYRLSDQRGVIYPIPTTPNSSSGGTTNANGNEGLQDIVYDAVHNRVYISNSGYNRIEVFDIGEQAFLAAIPVGQLPHQMALSTDSSTLYVGNTGSEVISIVDLNQLQVTGNVTFPPIPRNGTSSVVYPRTLAMGLFGLEFVMSDGSQWEVVNGTAVPRPANTVTPVALANTGDSMGPGYNMIATPDNSYILTMSGNGNAYLYNSITDTYQTGRLLFSTVQGYYGVLGGSPGGTYYLANGLVLNPSLTTLYGTATPSATTTNGLPGRNVAAVAPIDDTYFLRLTTPVRTAITSTTTDDSRTILEKVNVLTGNDTLVGATAENPIAEVFGTTRFNTTARQMVVDATGSTAYAITLSGMSAIPLAAATTSTVPAITSVVNASSGSSGLIPGSFITVNGSNLAATATASTIPPPTVLGGSCVTMGETAIPLISTSAGQIQAQIPTNLPTGTQVVEVRSLGMAQDSAPVTVTVKAAAGPTTTSPANERPGEPGRTGGRAEIGK